MLVLNIYEAKTHLSSLIQKAVNGEKVIIAKSGKPLVELIPYTGKENALTFGFLKGKIKIADDFDSFDEEIADMFADYTPDNR